MSLARRSGGGHGSQALSSRPEWVGVGEGSAAVMDRGNQSMIRMSASAQDHVNAYLEYERIVGDADGGVMMSEEEYEVFKANAIAHRANRIYVSWRCLKNGLECRTVGPTSPCFCGHRFRQHATDNHDKNIFCKAAGCPCTLYSYIPIRGTQDCKCTCKHSYDTHNVTGKRRCKTAGCTCVGFHSSLSCSCREQYGAHATVFETREERQAAGRPVDNLAGGGAGYEALGGVTSFSSLVDGVDRLAIGADGEQHHIGAGSSGSGSGGYGQQPPPSKKKLTGDDEFALYDAKYKGSSVGRGRPAAAAARSSAASAAGAGYDYDAPQLPAGHAAPPQAGQSALNLFLTSGAATAGALTSGASASRARLTGGSSGYGASGSSSSSSAAAGSRSRIGGSSVSGAGSRLR